MNIWQALLFAIWGPVFGVLTPYLLHSHFSQYLTGFVDYVVYILIFVIVGLLVADILTTTGGKIITKVAS